jgi:hypothetical protein
LFSNTLSICSSLNVRGQVSHPYRTIRKKIVLQIPIVKTLKDKINELATNSKNKDIIDFYTGVKEFRGGYQPRRKLVNDENSELPADSHNILNRWKNHFSQLIKYTYGQSC